jgi:hypothetical protein
MPKYQRIFWPSILWSIPSHFCADHGCDKRATLTLILFWHLCALAFDQTISRRSRHRQRNKWPWRPHSSQAAGLLAFPFGSRRIEAEEKCCSAIPPKKATALWKNSVKRPITPVASRNGSDAKQGTLWSAAEQPDVPLQRFLAAPIRRVTSRKGVHWRQTRSGNCAVSACAPL